jgi:16S rRNA (guanine(1405)-N(7))-methyltransferase
VPAGGSMLMEEVISIIVNKAIKKYKIDYDTAVDIVVEVVEKSPKFLELLEKELPLKEILKTRVYNEVDKKARRGIYYALRQYNKNIDLQETLIASLKKIPAHSSPGEYRGIIEKLVRSHISTKERLNSLDFFYRELFKYIGEPVSIVDVGCGMHPLLFPFEGAGKSVESYAALDKDGTGISALEAFSGLLEKNILHAIDWNIKDGWKMVSEKTGVQRFDVAFLMKLVPVVSRLERSLLDILLETPAQTWVITGSKTSMTKHMDIERRERRIIKQFIGGLAKEITGEFSTAEEFCMIVK